MLSYSGMRYVPSVIKVETTNHGATLHQLYSDVQT